MGILLIFGREMSESLLAGGSRAYPRGIRYQVRVCVCARVMCACLCVSVFFNCSLPLTHLGMLDMSPVRPP